MLLNLHIAVMMASLLAGTVSTSAFCPPPLHPASAAATDVSIINDGSVDPLDFFNQLVDRYQHLAEYEDSAQIVEITQRAGEQAQRRETKIITELDERGRLNVRTATAELRRSFGFCLPGPVSDPLEALSLRYALWMAPHMSLRYMDEDEPSQLSEVEQVVTRRMKPVEASPVVIDQRPLVHLELQPEEPTPAADDDETVNMYVNPDSMLIERVESRQLLSDGASVQTTVHIMPTHARSDEEVAGPATVPQSPDDAPVGLDVEQPPLPESPQAPEAPPAIAPASASGAASGSR